MAHVLHLSNKQQPFAPPFFYGWIIVAVGTLTMFLSGPGQTYSISIFIDVYVDKLGVSRSLVSSLYSGATLLSGSLLFLMGRAVDHFGHRTMSVFVGVMLVAACLLNAVIIGPVMLFGAFFFLRYFGQGSMPLLANTLIPQWFDEQRGRAFSIITAGAFASSAAFPPLNHWLIANAGWQTTWAIWAAVVAVVFIPTAFLLIRNQPEDVGLLPDDEGGTAATSGGRGAQATTLMPDPPLDFTVTAAMKTRSFWLVLFCAGVPPMIGTGITFHLVSIFETSGFEAASAAYTLTLMAVVAFPLTFAAGYLAERFPLRYILLFTFLIESLAVLVLRGAETQTAVLLYGVLWGAVAGFTRIAFNVIWPDYFGRTHLGSIRALAMTATVVGSAAGPLPFGIAYDIFGGYEEILLAVALLPLLAGAAAMCAPPPSREQEGGRRNPLQEVSAD